MQRTGTEGTEGPERCHEMAPGVRALSLRGKGGGCPYVLCQAPAGGAA